MACVILCLLSQTVNLTQPIWDVDNQITFDVRALCIAGSAYSDELVKLVQDCLAFDSVSGPDFAQKSRRIDTLVTQTGLNLAGGMMDFPTVSPALAHQHKLNFLPQDDYALGLSLADLPAR